MRVSAFLGDHRSGYSAQNVSQIWFWQGTLAYIPDGIGKLFTNLEGFFVSYVDRNLRLKLLQRRNFEDMPRLWYMDVKFNDIEWIDEDAFRELPNLQSLIIKNNKLKKLHKHTFARNPNLKLVDANSNQLEILHKELFNNNHLLESVSFKDNKLVVISADFSNFRHINEIDFRGNVCVDKEFKDDGLKLLDFHAVLNSNCKNVTVEICKNVTANCELR